MLGLLDVEISEAGAVPRIAVLVTCTNVRGVSYW